MKVQRKTRQREPAGGFDLLEIVRERFLADEIIDGRERPGRVAGQRRSVQQASGLFAAKRFAQRIPGKADHAVGRGQTFDTPIDRAARLETEDSRRLIR